MKFWEWVKRVTGLFTPTEQALYLSRLQIHDLRDRDALALAEHEKAIGEINAQILRLKAKRRAIEATFRREVAIRADAILALQADVDRMERSQPSPGENE
jgi:Arc/MetJ family transcription regulator